MAGEQGVPPYVIFHDATLMEMASQMPRNRQQMLEISGVGEKKFDRYGEPFLDLIGALDGDDVELQTGH